MCASRNGNVFTDRLQLNFPRTKENMPVWTTAFKFCCTEVASLFLFIAQSVEVYCGISPLWNPFCGCWLDVLLRGLHELWKNVGVSTKPGCEMWIWTETSSLRCLLTAFVFCFCGCWGIEYMVFLCKRHCVNFQQLSHPDLKCRETFSCCWPLHAPCGNSNFVDLDSHDRFLMLWWRQWGR